MNIKIFSFAIFALTVGMTAHAVETFTCSGTEPFWDATVAPDNITVTGVTGLPVSFSKVDLSSVGATDIDAVMSIKASNPKKPNLTVLGFVTRADQIIADEKGGAPGQKSLHTYCSDGMSNNLYPYSISVFVGDQTLTGCCWTATHPKISQPD